MILKNIFIAGVLSLCLLSEAHAEYVFKCEIQSTDYKHFTDFNINQFNFRVNDSKNAGIFAFFDNSNSSAHYSHASIGKFDAKYSIANGLEITDIVSKFHVSTFDLNLPSSAFSAKEGEVIELKSKLVNNYSGVIPATYTYELTSLCQLTEDASVSRYEDFTIARLEAKFLDGVTSGQSTRVIQIMNLDFISKTNAVWDDLAPGIQQQVLDDAIQNYKAFNYKSDINLGTTQGSVNSFHKVLMSYHQNSVVSDIPVFYITSAFFQWIRSPSIP